MFLDELLQSTEGVTSGAHRRGGPFGVETLPPNPLVCLCILLWETHSVKPSFPPSHLPQGAGPADLLMMAPLLEDKIFWHVLQCINLVQGQLEQCSPSSALHKWQQLSSYTPPPKSVHPSVSIESKSSTILFSSCQLLQLCPRQRFRQWWPVGARPSRLLEKEEAEHMEGGSFWGWDPPPNPLVCLCILLWETHSVKPSFPPSHLPQGAGPADLLMMHMEGGGVLLRLEPSHPNPLVCLCILLWETHSVKPSFPPSHLPQGAGPADLLM
ncbi:hypothetical protein E2320_006402, partial [Naja naja]